MSVTKIYTYQEQIDDLSEATGLSKQNIRRVLQYQRQLAQDKLRLGIAYNLKGVVKIDPKMRGDEVILSATVAQSIVRPITIQTIGLESPEEELEKYLVEDEEFI